MFSPQYKPGRILGLFNRIDTGKGTFFLDQNPAVPFYRDYLAGSVVLDLGHSCNLKCPWCYITKKLPYYYTKEDLCSLVKEVAARKLGWFQLYGGEPSLHPFLDDILHCARQAGIRRFALVTNGSGLVEKERVENLHRQGIKLWQLTWNIHQPEILDGHLPVAGHFETMQQAIMNISSTSESRILLYHILLPFNYPILPESVRRFARLREQYPAIHFVMAAMMKPTGRTKSDLSYLYRWDEATPYILEAIEVAEKEGLPFAVNHLPGCLIPSRREYHYNYPCMIYYNLDSDEYILPEFHGKKKSAPCLQCQLHQFCEGVPEKYANYFDDTIFRPTGSLLNNCLS